MCDDDKTWERNEESDPYYGEEYTPSFFDNMNHIESEDVLCQTQGDQAGEDIQEDGFWRDIRKYIEICFKKQPSMYLHGGDHMAGAREFYYICNDLVAALSVANKIKTGKYVLYQTVDRVVYEFDPKFKMYPEKAPYVIELVEGKASGHTIV